MEYTTKILIADESPSFRASLKDSLIRMGYRSIEEAANGEEALLKMAHFYPDIVIMDVWLSKLDGIGVLRQCRGMDWSQHTPPVFIVMSAVSGSNTFIQATEAGAELSRLHKQYDIRDVADTRQRLLNSCTPEELAAFYKVAHAYDQILLEEPEGGKVRVLAVFGMPTDAAKEIAKGIALTKQNPLLRKISSFP